MTDSASSILEVNLESIASNYLFLQKKLKKGTDCAAVVKADAYGLGAVEISKALYEQNCRHFFVATIEEGVEVRAALDRSPAQAGAQLAPSGPLLGQGSVYVLHGPGGANPKDFTAHKLIPVLNSPHDIGIWTSYAKTTGKKQPAILHLDTGMNRLGFTAKETAALDLSGLDVRYVMSHLACADEPQHPKNHEQLERFKSLTASLGAPFRLSLANSAGILLSDDYHFDLVRPGCGIYGINPVSSGSNPMHGVVTLKAKILQVRHVDSGETVGYGATYKLSAPAKHATVSAGYADGYFRSLTGRGTVVIGGKKCPVVGRVSMDSIVVDVTGLGPAPGDWAEIIGAHQTVGEVAAQAGTIGYEILTALGKRYKRTYR